MKKPISMPLPKCGKCKKTLEPQFTTEKEEGEEGKPEVLIMFGDCVKCNIRTMCNIVETKNIPDNLDAFVSNSEEVKK